MRKLALTGGPSGGKSTVLPFLQEKLADRGFYVLTVPESPTLLMLNGATPTRMPVESFQRHVVETMIFLEETFSRAAQEVDHSQPLILCDRGVPDCSAYMPYEVYEQVLKDCGITSPLNARDGRYDAVFHLRTAADGAEEFYTLANNKARFESPAQARAKDEATLQAWVGHPHLRVIDNRTGFEKKMKRVLQEACIFLGIPVPQETERKFLVNKVDLKKLGIPHQEIDIEQFYLLPPIDSAEEEVRLRKRGQYGEFMYYRTKKKAVSHGVRTETEKRADLQEYVWGQDYRKPGTQIVVKKRSCFVYKNQYFELDFFETGIPGLSLLEIELTDMQDTIDMPPFVRVIKEVTGDPTYSNYAIAHR